MEQMHQPAGHWYAEEDWIDHKVVKAIQTQSQWQQDGSMFVLSKRPPPQLDCASTPRKSSQKHQWTY